MRTLFQDTFSAWFQTAGAVLPLVALFAVPGAYAEYRWQVWLETVSREPGIPPLLWQVAVLLLLVPAQVIAVRAAMRRRVGAPIEVRELLGDVHRSFLPVLALYALVGLVCWVAWESAWVLDRALWVATNRWLSVSLGLYLPYVAKLVVFPAPAFLLTSWTVSVPALLAAQLGPVAALKRSHELTRGRRWRLLAAFALIGLSTAIAALGVLIVVMFLITITWRVASSADEGLTRPFHYLAWIEAVSFVIMACVGSILSIATGVAHELLRSERRAASEPPA